MIGEPDDPRRRLSPNEARKLPSGAPHYRAYVGPATQYDFMGATQFRLLTALGLRETHRVLDFGCGSLRAGRLLIPYLLPGNYYGLEPNRWLIDDAIDCELGRSILDVKQPYFRYDSDFDVSRFGVTFDFIVAQSIFSHMGADLVARTLTSFRCVLQPSGLILATFIHPHHGSRKPNEFEAQGWTYPGVTVFQTQTVTKLIGDVGLFGRPLPWFHPRQDWYLIAGDPSRLPSPADDAHLTGVVLSNGDLKPDARD